MTAGQYRHRVIFEKNTPTVNASRQPVDDWQTFCIRRGRRPIEPTPVEVIVPDANRSVVESLILHFRHDAKTAQIRSTFRAKYLGRDYYIESAVDPDGLQREIRITFKAREVAR